MRNCYDAHQGYARPKHFLVGPIIIVIVLAPVLVYALEMTHASFPSQHAKCSAPFLQITHHVFSFSRIYEPLTSIDASMSYPILQAKSSTHRMYAHDKLFHIYGPKVFTDNQMSQINYIYYINNVYRG
jgi:hypothetical protein